MTRRTRAWSVVAVSAALAACSGAPTKTRPAPTVSTIRTPSSTTAARRMSPYAPAQEDPTKRGNYTRGGLYAPDIKDSAPPGIPDVDLIPEPEVRDEPRSLYGNRSPYEVLGVTYSVLDDPSTYNEVGLASFYGNKFHGRRTSNLEVYDMYAFTAAHRTLPLPSFARVTNLANGRSVVVRVNDRGPFHPDRIIDLSYAAAVKLGLDRAGTARVEVRGLRADDGSLLAARPPAPAPQVAAVPVPVATTRAAATAIDHLVDALPIGAAQASERPQPHSAATLAPKASGERFDMLQNGRTMTADEFDRWMRQRQLRVATGQAAAPARVVPARAVPAAPPPAPGSTGGAMPPATGPGGSTLQIASFAARANAEHALALLNTAGIDGARLLDADANGRKVWRLRVGPVSAAAMPELIARIQGLGFGQPQRVRE